MRNTCRSLLVAAMLAACGAAGAQTSAPPAVYRAPVDAKSAAQPALLAPDVAPSRVIVLAQPTARERAALAPKSASTGTRGKPANKRATIGFARTLPASDAMLRLADLDWTTVDGIKVATIRITSPTAAALRVQVRFADAPASAQLRFAGSGNARVFGPYTPADTAGPEFWSPVLEGDTVIVEIALPVDAAPGDATVALPVLSHMVIAGADLKQADPLGSIGQAGSCEIDVVCVSPALQQQAAAAINATARVVLTMRGTTYLCSGTLVNDSSTSGTPYLFTANHCIDSDDPAAAKGSPAAAAASINTYWFFQTNQCNMHSSSAVNFVMLPGGAKLLGRSVDYDWNLMVLNGTPPDGATLAAWSAAGPLATSASVDAIHHPEGDLKKFSQGMVTGYDSYNDGSTFIGVQWSQGVTEPGSSGSGLFTYNGAKNYFELRGALFGGDSSCSTPTGKDEYSRLDSAFPRIAKYLSPTTVDAQKKVLVTEFYNATLDDYFITASDAEIRDLDTGVHPGWVRTGYTFLAYSDPSVAPSDAQAVCRFYVLPQVGDSHFYSADPAECASTAKKFASTWLQESAAVFYIQVPNKATGTCPAFTRAVYRFVNNANGLHHRYTTEVDVRGSTISDGGWTQEGYGPAPTASVMCTPNA